MVASDVKGVMVTALSFSGIVRRLVKQEFAFEATQLGFVVTLFHAVDNNQRFVYGVHPLPELSKLPVRISQESQKIGVEYLCPYPLNG